MNMRGTGLFINWENGSKNSNAISEFKKRNIAIAHKTNPL